MLEGGREMPFDGLVEEEVMVVPAPKTLLASSIAFCFSLNLIIWVAQVSSKGDRIRW